MITEPITGNCHIQIGLYGTHSYVAINAATALRRALDWILDEPDRPNFGTLCFADDDGTVTTFFEFVFVTNELCAVAEYLETGTVEAIIPAVGNDETAGWFLLYDYGTSRNPDTSDSIEHLNC